MLLSEQKGVAAAMRAATECAGALGEATAYHLSTGGRGWRAGLILSCARSLGAPAEHAVRLAAACELVHQASIVHDDVQDKALVRRGRPSVAVQYGSPVAICVGDYLLARAFKMLAPLPCAPDLIALFADRVTEMAVAQADEFTPAMWHAMSHARYAALAAGKAGAMVALSVESAALLGGLSGTDILAAGRAGRLLGTAYQVGDDIEDVSLDLARGALNGVLAVALDLRVGVERDRVLQLLARAQLYGFSRDDANRQAARFLADAARLSAWASDLLVEAVGGLGDHPLGPVLFAAANELGVRSRHLSGVARHAA